MGKTTGPEQAVLSAIMDLFNGLDRAHGKYDLGPEVAPGAKRSGRASTVLGPATAKLWHEHLVGNTGLGVVPIRADNSCVFGAIDIDVPGIDLQALQRAVQRQNLPLVVCRSKSAGAHLYIFLKSPTPAAAVRQSLLQWSSSLGHPKAEVFPKQTALVHRSDVGNWINMPYFGAYTEAGTDRYALKGRSIIKDVNEFIKHAQDSAIDMEVLDKLAVGEPKVLEGGPPCLQHLIESGFPQGSRNNALFDMGVYARKRYGDLEWEQVVEGYNAEFMTPGTSAEVQNVIKSLRKKNYEYMCDQPPICDHCNRSLCRTRRFGIGRGDTEIDIVLDDLVRLPTDPVTWSLTIDGHRVGDLATGDLMSQNKFRERCVEKLGKLPSPVSMKKWNAIISALLANQRVVEVPEDAGVVGQFLQHLRIFLSNQPKARERDELIIGKVWQDDGDPPRTYFRSPDLLRYLERERYRTDARAMYNMLRNSKMEFDTRHHKFNIKGVACACWSVKTPSLQTEELDVDVTLNDDSEF